MSIELIPLCTVEITLGEQIFVGAGGAGMRVITEVDAAMLSGRGWSRCGARRRADHLPPPPAPGRYARTVTPTDHSTSPSWVKGMVALAMML